MSILASQTLNQSLIQSQLKKEHILRPHGNIKKNTGATLTLTSLVDCFTILIVYLLVATSYGAEDIEVHKDIQLPKAAHSTAATQGITVMVMNGKFFIGKREISVSDLAETLQNEKTKTGLSTVIIQANKDENFIKLNPVVLSILQAGFDKVRFAVLQEDES